MDIKTKLAQAGIIEDETFGAISSPIYQSATFIHRNGQSSGYDYSRTSNPTRDALEKTLADIEYGAGACAFASGMAAITAILSLYKTGDRILVSDDLYCGTYRLFENVFASKGIIATYIDTSSIDTIEHAFDVNTKAVFIETPTNPMMKIADIERIASLLKKRNIRCIVDNTFMTPYLQNPLQLGADFVVHSGTKYLGGHNDALCGIVVSAQKSDHEQIQFMQNATGGVLSPFDSWLILRGLKTLALRIDKAQDNAKKIAEWMLMHPAITEVIYQGLDKFADRKTHEKQARGYGAMLSFKVKDAALAVRITEKVNIIRFAESLGGVESLITRPSTQTHAFMPVELRERLGITDNLLRLSVGIESTDDLINDLKNAMEDKK